MEKSQDRKSDLKQTWSLLLTFPNSLAIPIYSPWCQGWYPFTTPIYSSWCRGQQWGESFPPNERTKLLTQGLERNFLTLNLAQWQPGLHTFPSSLTTYINSIYFNSNFNFTTEEVYSDTTQEISDLMKRTTLLSTHSKQCKLLVELYTSLAKQIKDKNTIYKDIARYSVSEIN